MISPGEARWLRDEFHRLYRKAPKRRWRWGAVSSGWDFSEVYAAMRREATIDGDEIWRALETYAATGSWPKLSGRAAEFLRERLAEAEAVCEKVLRTANPEGPDPAPVRPANAELIARQLVVDHWDRAGVVGWLEDNKRDFQEPGPDD